MAFERTLIQIRERSHLDLLDLALLVVRHRPGTLALAALAGIAPLISINAWLLADRIAAPGYWLVVLFLEAPWATVPLTLVLGGLMFGQPPRTGAILKRVARAVPSLILLHMIVRPLLGITFLLIPIIPGQLWFANEVILLERAGGLAAIRRCRQLSTDRTGDFFLQWLGQLALGLTFVICFWVGAGAAFSGLFQSELTWDRPTASEFQSLRFQLPLWMAVAFFGVARFLIYLDQRIRSEGWELRLRPKNR
jgi:hypothetical protein